MSRQPFGRPRAVVAFLAAAFATAVAACPDPVRVAVLDFDESERKPQGIGMTALQSALARRVGEAADVPMRIRQYPYQRALQEFRRHQVDAIVVAEGAGRRAVPNATRVPMMRLLFVRIRVEGRPLSPAAADLGMLTGMVPPPGAMNEGDEVQVVTNYAALLRQLLGGRVNRIIAARPTVDSYLVDHPEQRDRLAAMEPVGEQPMTLHLHPGLDPSCRAHLARVAADVAHRELAAIFRRTSPGIDPAPFLLVPEPAAADAR